MARYYYRQWDHKNSPRPLVWSHPISLLPSNFAFYTPRFHFRLHLFKVKSQRQYYSPQSLLSTFPSSEASMNILLINYLFITLSTVQKWWCVYGVEMMWLLQELTPYSLVQQVGILEMNSSCKIHKDFDASKRLQLYNYHV